MKPTRYFRWIIRCATLVGMVVLTACDKAVPASTTNTPPNAVEPTTNSITPPTPSEEAGHILWSADFETGDFSEWTQTTENATAGGIYNTGTGVASITRDIVHSGKYAAKLTISQAGGKHGPQAVRIFRKKESQSYPEAYYSAWYYFPQIYHPDDSWNIFQFKSKSDDENEVFWKLDVRNRQSGQMYLILRDKQNDRDYEQTLVNLPIKKWVHIEVYYKQSANNTGHITLWQDGVQLADVDGITTMLADATQTANWSINNYTNRIRPGRAVIYIDDVIISTARIGPHA